MNQVFVKNRAEWRTWLEENHANTKEIWIVYFKKHTGQPSISYRDSVKEAIAFGWVDGIKKRLDEETYTHRFTPRRQNSKWSPLNIEYAQELIEAGLMTAAGLTAYEQRKAYDQDFLRRRAEEEPALTPEMEQSLRKNSQAWANFQNLAPSYRRQYILWLTSAKRATTRQRRLREAIQLLENNEKLGMK